VDLQNGSLVENLVDTFFDPPPEAEDVFTVPDAGLKKCATQSSHNWRDGQSGCKVPLSPAGGISILWRKRSNGFAN